MVLFSTMLWPFLVTKSMQNTTAIVNWIITAWCNLEKTLALVSFSQSASFTYLPDGMHLWMIAKVKGGNTCLHGYLTTVWTWVVLEIPLPIILRESFCNRSAQSKKDTWERERKNVLEMLSIFFFLFYKFSSLNEALHRNGNKARVPD